MNDTTAYCGRDGVIRFCQVGENPQGTLPIATAPLADLNHVFAALARHAYGNETYLVPGVPEAADGDAAVDALCVFYLRVKEALEREGRVIAEKGKRRCRGCGCTGDTPCLTLEGPCFWVEADLCSSCATASDVQAYNRTAGEPLPPKERPINS